MKLLLLCFLAVAAVAMPADLGTQEPVEAVDLVVNGVEEGEPLELDHIVQIQMNHHSEGQLVASSDLLYPLTAQGLAESLLESEDAELPEGIALPSPAVPEVVPEGIALPSPATPEVVPESVVLPSPAVPEVIPEGIALPSPATPEVVLEVPESVALPSPAVPEVVPEGIALPSPAVPEVVPEGIALPNPATPEVVPESVVLPSPAVPAVVPEAPESVALPSPAVPEVIPDVALPGPAVPEVIAPEAPQVPSGEIYNDGLVQVTLNLPEDQGVLATLSSWLSIVYNYIQNGIPTTAQIV